MSTKIKNDISKLQIARNRVINNAEPGQKKNRLIFDMDEKIQTLQMSLPNKPLTIQNSIGGHTGVRPSVETTGSPYSLKGPNDKKDYTSLFGSNGYTWPDKNTGFFQAFCSGRHHPGLIQNTAGLSEGTPSSGGTLVPQELSSQIHSVSLENELIMPLATVMPMMSNDLMIPAMDIGSHVSSLYGSFVASYTPENGEISVNNPKVRQISLNAKKLTGMCRFSNELVQDAQNGEKQIIDIIGQGISYYRDKAFISGSGAGEPQGLLSADCLVTVEKEIGQAADTIVWENLTKQMAAMFTGSFANSVWLINQQAIPQLLTLSVSVGTGGSVIPVMSSVNGQFTILSRPVYFTAKLPVLGDKGDCLLVDLSQYVIGMRSQMKIDLSIHAGFEYDQLLVRLIERHDSSGIWDESLTQADGSEVSPFVCIAERS